VVEPSALIKLKKKSGKPLEIHEKRNYLVQRNKELPGLRELVLYNLQAPFEHQIPRSTANSIPESEKPRNMS
jgi:hypothetical protein